jgi:hypothetical protein
MDRRLEHLNRLAKALLEASGHQNLSEKLAAAIGSAIQPMHDLGIVFDKVSGVPLNKTYIDKDREVNTEDEAKMLKILQDANVFRFIRGRQHPDFEFINANPMDDVDANDLRRYVMDWGKSYLGFQRALYSIMYPVV